MQQPATKAGDICSEYITAREPGAIRVGIMASFLDVSFAVAASSGGILVIFEIVQYSSQTGKEIENQSLLLMLHVACSGGVRRIELEIREVLVVMKEHTS